MIVRTTPEEPKKFIQSLHFVSCGVDGFLLNWGASDFGLRIEPRFGINSDQLEELGPW